MKVPAVVALAALSACQPGRGVLQVTVGGKATGVDHLVVTVIKDGRPSTPNAFKLDTDTIPPEQTLGLRFAPEVSGAVTVQIDAAAVGGMVVASGSAPATVDPGGSTQVTVLLGGGEADMGADDLGGADFAVEDLTPPPDLNGADLRYVFNEQPKPSPSDINAIWGAAPNDIWIAGNGGRLYHGNGAIWTTWPHPFGQSAFNHLAGSGPSDVWVVGNTSIIGHWNGIAWQLTNQVPDAGALASFEGVATNGTDVYVVGDQGTILHTTNQGQTWLVESVNTNNDFKAVAFSPDGNVVVAVGSSSRVAVKKLGDQSFTSGNLNPQVTLHGVWIAPTGTVVAVGSTGGVFTGDPLGAYMFQSVTVDLLQKVWGAAADDVYVVGDNQDIFHSTDLKSWVLVSTGKGLLFDVWGSGPLDVYAVGANGLIVHHP